MREEIGNNGNTVRTGGPNLSRALRGNSANGHERYGPNCRFPLCDALQALRRPFHDLELGLENRAKGNVGRPRRQGNGQLLFAMRTNAKACRLATYGLEVGTGQVLLAQKNEIGPQLQSLAPVVVDDQLAAVAGANLQALGDLAANAFGRAPLLPQ